MRLCALTHAPACRRWSKQLALVALGLCVLAALQSPANGQAESVQQNRRLAEWRAAQALLQAGSTVERPAAPRRLPVLDANQMRRLERQSPGVHRIPSQIVSESRFGVRTASHTSSTTTTAPIVIERATGDLPPATPRPAALTGDHQPGYAFNFREAPWDVVLRSFAGETSMSLHMAKSPDGTFSYFDANQYTIDDAIDILNDYLLPTGAILIRHENKLTVASIGSGIPDEWIPYYRHNELHLIGRNALATVVMPVDRMDPQKAVAEIQQMLSSVGKVQVLAASNRIVVTDTGTYLRRVHELLYGAGISQGAVKSHVFRLRNAKANEIATAINSFLLSKRTPTGFGNVQPPKVSNVVPEPTTNSLLVHGTIQELTEIHALIQRLDSAPPQVLIQAVLVEVQLGNTDEFGVELGIQDSVLFDRSVLDNVQTITETFQDGSLKSTTQSVLSQLATPGFNFNNQPLGLNSVANPGHVAPQALSNFGVGRVNGDLGFGGLVLSAGSESISVLLRALSAKFKTDVLSRPQIRALDNREALIQIGQQVPIVDGVSITPVGSANPVIRQDKAGIILRVTPRVGPNGAVMIDVNAEKSSFQLAPGTGVPIFTDLTNGNVIEAPVKDITTANTAVRVMDGQTIVLGGMITKDVTVVERKVPGLGNVPILGKLFRFDLEQTTRRELLIFLTPKIIYGDDHNEQLVNDEMSRMCFPHEIASEFHPEVHASRAHAPFLPTPEPAYRNEAYTTDGELIPTDQPVLSNAPGDWLPLTRWMNQGPSDGIDFEILESSPHPMAPVPAE